MRWFKCLVLCVGHIMVHLSLAFIPVSDETLKYALEHEFLKWIGISISTGFISMSLAAYLVALPITECLKRNRNSAHCVIMVVAMLYFANLSIMLWAMQHMLIQSTVIQCYTVSGQIGLVFGLLVLYDNMKGENVKDLYERVLEELDDELEMTSNKVGIEDNDLQRERV